MLSMKQIEAAIGTQVTAEIPYDPGLYLKAINEGIPIVRGAPNSAPARALGKLASLVSGVREGVGPGSDDRRGLLGGLRRRG
jgi:Flp pilus assembly CpaE family ATPase